MRTKSWLLPFPASLRRARAEVAADFARFVVWCCSQCEDAPEAIATLEAWKGVPHGRAKAAALPAVLATLRRFGIATGDDATVTAMLLHNSKLASRRAKRADERARQPRKPRPTKRLDGCPRRVWH